VIARPAPVQVHVLCGAVSPFGIFPDVALAELARPVISEALLGAGIQSAQIEAAFVGNAFGGLIQGQESILGQLVLGPMGLTGIPVHNVKNACSSGADAVHLAWTAVAYGQYDCVLAVGAEKMSHADRGRTLAALATASDLPPSSGARSVFMELNARRAQAYMARYGAQPRHFALCAAKNRRHAALNPKAAVRAPLTWEQVLADRMIADPLTRSMCGGIADGAAALVLCSGAFARRSGGRPMCRLRASTIVSGMPASGGGSNATVRAAREAFAAAGMEPAEISLAEVHDATAPQELFDLEDIGFCGRGEAAEWTERGVTSLGGRLPVNVSGGLTCRGHPVGATGVAQIVELAEQLAGRSGQRQVRGARAALAQMAGGVLGSDSAVASVHLLSN
jgi:acetyl-CoA acyltransferase